MKWIKQDLQQFVEAKEYVDTALIPLIPFQMSKDSHLENDAFQRNVIDMFTRELEKELTGRVMLIPEFFYLASSQKNEEVKRINTWIQDISMQPFNHVFLITGDSDWKTIEEKIQGTLLWLPSVVKDNMESSEIHSIVNDQVHEVIKLIRSYWHNT